MEKIAAIYTRVSTTKQEEEGTSLETQKAECLRYAERNGFTVPPEFMFEDAWSGAEIRDRPALGRMREAIRKRRVNAVICFSLDRLTRKQAHIAILAEEAEEHGVELRFVIEQFDKGAVGEFIRAAKAFAAELEREKILERTQRGAKARVLDKGRPSVGWKPPYGYRYEGDKKDRLAPDPETADVVRWMFEMALEGRSSIWLADDLNRRGIPVPTKKPGAKWRPSTISAMMKNTVYYGEHRAFVKSRENHVEGKKGWHADQGVLVPGVVAQPLVTPELFHAANAAMRRRMSEAPRNMKVEPESALLRSGHVFCGYCGGSMTLMPTKHRDRNGNWVRHGSAYRCSPMNRKAHGCPAHAISTRVIDDLVWNHLVSVLETEEEIEKNLKRAIQGEDQPDSIDMRLLEKRLGEIKREEDKLAAAIPHIENDAVLSTTIARINELGRLRKELEPELRELRERRDVARQRATMVNDAVNFCLAVRDMLHDAEEIDYETKRLALYGLGVRVFVRKQGDPEGRFSITWSLPTEPHTRTITDLELAATGSLEGDHRQRRRQRALYLQTCTPWAASRKVYGTPLASGPSTCSVVLAWPNDEPSQLDQPIVHGFAAD